MVIKLSKSWSKLLTRNQAIILGCPVWSLSSALTIFPTALLFSTSAGCLNQGQGTVMYRSSYSQKISFTDIFSNLKSVCKFVLVLNFFGLVFQVQQKQNEIQILKLWTSFLNSSKKIKTKQNNTKRNSTLGPQIPSPFQSSRKWTSLTYLIRKF